MGRVNSGVTLYWWDWDSRDCAQTGGWLAGQRKARARGGGRRQGGARISVTLMRANAEIILSRARQQGTICPAHAHRARVSHLTAHRTIPSKFQVPHDRRNLAHSRSLRVLHVMAHRRVTCEFPGGLSFYCLIRKKTRRLVPGSVPQLPLF
eukprot:scaffold12603_cov146-Isochrysis_galbana.AAC.1